MLRKLLLYVLAVMVMAGFTSVSEQLKTQMGQMPQHYTQFDVKMGWAVTAE